MALGCFYKKLVSHQSYVLGVADFYKSVFLSSTLLLLLGLFILVLALLSNFVLFCYSETTTALLLLS